MSYLAAAMTALPMAVLCLFDRDLLPIIGCTLPFFLYIAAAVTALTDKRQQINEYRMKYPLKKEV